MITLGWRSKVGLAGAVLVLWLPGSAWGADGFITGKVTSGGADVANLLVEAYAVGAASATDTDCTANDGVYQLSVPPGTYEVHFNSAGGCGGPFDLAPQWYSGRGIRAFADTVSVGDGLSTTADAQMKDGASVTGTVTAAAGGSALPGVTVDLLDISLVTVATACTAADGTYTLAPLVGGVYSVRFNAAGSCGNAGDYATQWFDNATSQAQAEAVGLGDAENRSLVDAALVAGPSGTPQATLSVAKAGTGGGEVTSSPPGISCRDVCAAKYDSGTDVTLTASAGAGSVFAGWSGGGCNGTGTCTVKLNSDQAVTATFNLPTAPGGTTSPPPATAPPATGVTPVTPLGTLPGAAVQTKLRSSVISARKGTATFTFSGTGGSAPRHFQCALSKGLAKPRFKRCRSPMRYRRLKKGRYRFSVRAVDAKGKVDRTPAQKSFSSRRR